MRTLKIYENICPIYCSLSKLANPVSQEKQDTLLLPITLSNVDRFLNFFYRQTQQ